ncbi:hypothetical protein OEW28_12005 [Defluviimonas sp. WL0002]|uniref:Uncharacterized protein n=1 Tax=Albidovulum marisflavi TaxID=2984159 RepID=A0ABT2ZDZ1_9RHOB|nr:hypothetical protein [Defluviimonas sp. WL0002]MCV2869349.1 hypothetical protein [Defluviimonas sp. WL0002]
MAKSAPEDAAALKAVREAEKGLVRLQKELRKSIKKFTNGESDRQKIKAAQSKILDFMARQKSTLKLQRSAAFDKLSEEAQAGLVWLDGVTSDLNNLLGRLEFCKRMMKRDPEGDRKILVKTVRDFRAEIGQPPKGLGVLLKMVKQGTEARHPAGAQLAALPMIILFWLMVETIVRGLRKR